MQLFWQDLVNGILVGGIFAVVALGFSLVWGIMNIINLAHGAFIMLGAYTAYVLFTAWHVDPFISIPIAFVLLFALGYCIQRFVINFVVRAPLLTTFLLTFGLSLLIVNLALLVFHGDTKGITTAYSGSNFSIGPVTVAWTKLWTLIVALAITALMQSLLSKHARPVARSARWRWTSTPRSSPACDVAHLYAIVFGLGAGLAGAAGVLISLSYSLQPSMGDPFIITAFVVLRARRLGHGTGRARRRPRLRHPRSVRLAVHRHGPAGCGGAGRALDRADRAAARHSR